MRIKLHITNIKFSLIFISFISILLFQSCNDQTETLKWVDLRYRVDDSYVVEASNPEDISFLVKSTDPWKVIGKYDWYSISPDQGDADEVATTVTISFKENNDLDDRIDTISIKSDYWTGKRFTITQKGTAYLNVSDVDNISQFGETVFFDVLSNQNWTAKVTKGNVWLSIETGNSGSQNGKVSVKAGANSGEQRTGIITIFDRHGKVAQQVECTQNGVLLTPAVPENEKWFAIYEEAQQLIIPVESNAKWTVSKDNEIDDDWFTFEKTTFEGSDQIVINVSEHLGSSVRTAVIVLSTEAEDGATPLVKTVKFKQANPKIPEVKNVNTNISGDYYGPGSLMPGRYNFYYEPFTATAVNLFFIWNSTPYAELRFHINNKVTALSTTPWSSDVHGDNNSLKLPVDTSKPNVLSFDIQKVADDKDPTKSWIYTEWILNDVVIARATSNGRNNVTGAEDTWKVPFENISMGGNFLIRTVGGSMLLSKYEYIAPLVWGE